MAHLIRLLPDALASQIAAGEVVQRPASVVKELMENSIDAGSTEIKLIIKNAGKTLIQVVDDGQGMTEVDARMCFERHATSKITTSDDLFKIRTMGFRGEAMASISAVTQVVLETCTEQAELGTQVSIEGADVKSQEPIAAFKGTKVSVKNLFFNVPARRNFLRSNPVETKHIIDEFQRIALSRPEIAFSFFQDDLEVYQLPVGKLSHRIVHLFGRNYKEQLITCEEDTDLLQAKGYIGKPEYAKKTRGEQFFFVNGRFIKSSYLHHAVKSAFEDILPDNTFPFYVLFLTIDPSHIDINVHPTKTEIKFDDERVVYAVLEAAVKKALAVHHVTPSIDFSQNVNASPFNFSPLPRKGTAITNQDSNYTQFKTPSTQKGGQQPWEKVFESALSQHTITEDFTDSSQLSMESLGDASHRFILPRTEAISPSTPYQKQAKPKLQLHNQYILTQVKSGLLLVDQSAAHERILYERYLRVLRHEAAHSQQMLFPQSFTLNKADFALMEECEHEIKKVGFELELSGKDTVTVMGMPPEVTDKEPTKLLENLLEQYKWNKKSLAIPKTENLARALAKRSCLQSGKELTISEMEALIDQLFSCGQPNYTADGQKTHTIIPLEGLFETLNV